MLTWCQYFMIVRALRHKVLCSFHIKNRKNISSTEKLSDMHSTVLMVWSTSQLILRQSYREVALFYVPVKPTTICCKHVCLVISGIIKNIVL